MNTLLQTLIPFISKAINARAGGFAQWIAGLIVAWIVNIAARHGFNIPQEAITEWQTAIVAVCLGLVAVITQLFQTLRVEEVQTNLGLKPDGDIRDKTKATSKEAGAALAALKAATITTP